MFSKTSVERRDSSYSVTSQSKASKLLTSLREKDSNNNNDENKSVDNEISMFEDNVYGDGEIQKRLIINHEGMLDSSLLERTEGYMLKKGGAVNARGGLHNWKKRWFELVEVDSYFNINYFFNILIYYFNYYTNISSS